MFVASYSHTEAGIRSRMSTIIEFERKQRMKAEAELAASQARQAKIDAEEAAKAKLVEAAWAAAQSQDRVFKGVTYADIERRACKLFKCTKNEIRSGRRNREIVFARQFIMYWAARLTTISLPMMGRFMGRDHTTCLHGKVAYVAKRKAMGRNLREAR